MPPRSSTFRDVALAAALVAASTFAATSARAQACCAGTGALTPGRLAGHEAGLVGLQARAGSVYGGFDSAGTFTGSPAGTTEHGFEEALFGATRFARRGQVAVFAPLVQTRRATPTSGPELGGGLGDVNASARWDFVSAGERRPLPGVGLLAGVTLPTGKPPEASTRTLATNATGVGALQGNAGVAVEQTYGHFLVNVTGVVALRAPRTARGIRTALGPQITVLAGTAYSFDNDAAIGVLASFTVETPASVDGVTVPGSGRRLFRLSGAGTYPLDDRWRLQATPFVDLPFFGQNQPSQAGLSFGVIRSWS